MLCEECNKKHLCTTLCPEAELFINQDTVPQREKTVGLPTPKPWPEFISSVYLTKMQREIVTLLGRGLTRKDVCQTLEITRVALRMHMKRLREKCYDFDL